MALDPGTYDVEFLQNAEVQSTGEFTLDGTSNLARMQFAITTADFGISISSNLTTNRNNLQDFIDYCWENDVTGIIEAGTWEINDVLRGRNGLRLMGRGMGQGMTFIDAPPGDWVGSDAATFRIDTSDNSGNLNKRGLYLADFRTRSPDRERTDTGGSCVRIQATSDLVIERLRIEDGSSYGLFVSGYGVFPDGFSNDIEGEGWNAGHRATVRDCLFLRGQIGAGTEGGFENILFQRCASFGAWDNNADEPILDKIPDADDSDPGNDALHGFRHPSGRNITHHKCSSMGYRTGITLDRYQRVHVDGCNLDGNRQGIGMGAYEDGDPYNSFDVRITNNYIRSIPDFNNKTHIAINDNFITSGRRICEGVLISGNIIGTDGGYIALRQSKQVNCFGNIARTSNSTIECSHSATGQVFGNLMNVSNSASGMSDGGNNGFVGT